LNKRTPREIIEDWVFTVWKIVRPSSFDSRQECYFMLFNTFAEEGYSWENIGSLEEKVIKSFTVPNKGTKAEKDFWNESADKYILQAKMAAFGPRGKIASGERKFSAEEEELKDKFKKEEEAKAIKKEKLEDLPPLPPKPASLTDKKLKEAEGFKFDLTIEDLLNE